MLNQYILHSNSKHYTIMEFAIEARFESFYLSDLIGSTEPNSFKQEEIPSHFTK